LGIGDCNPPSPIPNPQSPIELEIHHMKYNIDKINKNVKKIILLLYNKYIINI